MKQNKFAEVISQKVGVKRTIISLFLIIMLSVCMTGCSSSQISGAENTSENAPSNNAYMSQVNIEVDSLSECLQKFSDAVSDEDLVGMRTQADNASAILDKIAAIEAPEDLTDLKSEYTKGADQLKMALNSYVSLYSQMATATDAAPFDYSTFEDEVAKIQNQYDEGVKTLEDADTHATEM